MRGVMRIDVDKLSFHYRNREVFRDVSFTVKPNEITAILGVSGCGKSTLVKLLAGLISPSSGTVRYGQESSGLPSDNEISVIFQNPTLFPWKTVAENVLLARVQGAQGVEEIAKEIGMLDALNLYPDQLSGGMAQRVEFGRVMARKPKLLFMDEPFSKLDVQFRVHLQQMFLHIHELHKPTTILVTHDIREALKVASHIKVLVGGPVSKVIEYETHDHERRGIMEEVEGILQKDFEGRHLR